MPNPRALLATLMLAALAVGGVALPVAHDLAHAAEQAETRLAHSDHHHHEVGDDHGAEAVPFCPDAAEADLVCALCQAHAAASLQSADPNAARDAAPRRATTQDRAGEAWLWGTLARGPPAA